ncbi:hypothetical protein BAY37_03200 [Mycoplasmoides gallisepticum]|uniref:Haemagglutinin Mycoplasma domain-containing protein n=1 Tax=Mycoplasmoides gallisepticum TaxID=2096 RepID=A0AB36DTV5_MYCGL|nr:hypothetical protein BAY36_01715 [Mycoplasmoides gallisepticum]OBU78827.1 hypothetical protein BAY37_03200 [Mycoplasmoides gallisepticum]OBU81055.1 hypothetical protein BAX52_01030 [Mycoplasmoides gallisepticum]OBZ53334.1 hypothetical protein BBG00_01590 [Mycoplasmoides gallisepticum]
MNGGDTNAGNGGGMDNAAQQLAAVRTALTTLINSRTQNTELYVDYTKIQDTLVKAYDAAKIVLDNTVLTTQNINQAKTTLETAINVTDKARTDFNAANSPLVTAYNALKETLKNEETVLGGLTDSNFVTIKTNLTVLYQSGKDFVKATLDPVSGNAPQSADITKADKDITDAVSKLETWKTNATVLATNFLKKVLVKANLTNSSTDNNQEQPGNYSFVGYSVDVTGTSGQETTIPNWDFAQRAIFTSGNQPAKVTATTTGEDQSTAKPLSDVSWIYSLADTGTKYTLEFTYYGPSTGWLYFPYKLAKAADDVGLQYKLNSNETLAPITFGDQANASGPAATVDNINVAKVRLTGLAFGKNTIEFSVPMGKVAPMIRNMYLTSLMLKLINKILKTASLVIVLQLKIIEQ